MRLSSEIEKVHLHESSNSDSVTKKSQEQISPISERTSVKIIKTGESTKTKRVVEEEEKSSCRGMIEAYIHRLVLLWSFTRF